MVLLDELAGLADIRVSNMLSRKFSTGDMSRVKGWERNTGLASSQDLIWLLRPSDRRHAENTTLLRDWFYTDVQPYRWRTDAAIALRRVSTLSGTRYLAQDCGINNSHNFTQTSTSTIHLLRCL